MTNDDTLRERLAEAQSLAGDGYRVIPVIEFQRCLARRDAAVLRSAAQDAESDADSDDHNPTTMRVYRAWSQWLYDRADHIERGQAAAVPDGGDDTLREQVAETLRSTPGDWPGQEREHDWSLYMADALLPVIREHIVQAQRERADELLDAMEERAETAEAAVQTERERAAQPGSLIESAIERLRREKAELWDGLEAWQERAEAAEARLQDVRIAANWHLGHEDPAAGDALAKKILQILDKEPTTVRIKDLPEFKELITRTAKAEDAIERVRLLTDPDACPIPADDARGRAGWRFAIEHLTGLLDAADDYIGPGMRVSPENNAAIVDQVARAIHDSAQQDEPKWTDWDQRSEEIRDHWRPYARAALAAMNARAALDEESHHD